MVLVHEYVTGGGLAGQDLPPSLAAEGAAMRRALAADFAALEGVRVVTTLDARLPAEPGPWEAVPVGPGAEVATLGRLADKADEAVVIAPETGGILAERIHLLMGHRARVLGPTPAAVEAAADKLLLARRLAGAGVATPAAEPVRAVGDLPDLLPFPAVLKPIDGAGALDTFLLADPNDRSPGVFDHLPALVQPFVPGEPWSASFLVDVTGRAHLVGVGRQHIEMIDGRFTYRGGTVPAGAPAMADEARRAVAAVPGLRGWVGVDFVWQTVDGRAVVLEINPRATTSLVGLARLLPPGTLARAWLDAFDRPETFAALDLARLVHAREPQSFAADGTIDDEEAPR